MVHYHRYHVLRKGGELQQQQHEDEESIIAFVCSNSSYYRRLRPKLVSLVILSLLSCCLILLPHRLCSSSAFSRLYSFGVEEDRSDSDINGKPSLCSSVSNGTMCCDRSSFRSDICIMKGDVRIHSSSSSIFLYSSRKPNSLVSYVSSMVDEKSKFQHEKIRPYTRKWEKSVMDTIDELKLISKEENSASNHHCDVKHDVPAVFFSTGGYTGNVYHEFNDGIIPLYITSQHFKKKVVFVILEYHNWWIMKYGNILSHLTDYPAIDFRGDKRTHCFPEAIVGLRIHDELTVDSSLMQEKKTIVDFRNVLDQAYWPRIRGLIQDEERKAQKILKEKMFSLSPSSATSLLFRKEDQEKTLERPKLVILSRNGSRSVTNENMLVKMAEDTGFLVEVLKPDRKTELAKIYRSLNSSDVMIGVHGAAMTHFLFMRPGSVFIQVVPLGTEWAAETYYGEPARKLGLKYVGYQIHPSESSLYDKYDKNDPVLQDPESIAKKGWQYTKSIYLDNQNVKLNLRRFQKWLVRSYYYSKTKIRRDRDHW